MLLSAGILFLKMVCWSLKNIPVMNLRAVVDVEPSKYMKFGINMYGTHSVRDTGNSDLLQDAFRLRPTYHPTDLVTGEEMWAYSNGQYNALTTMKNELNKTKKYNLLSNNLSGNNSN